MFVCTGRFGVLHLTKNAETRHTRIHTYTHTFVFFFQGLKPCFMQACIWGNLHFLCVKNALLGHGWGHDRNRIEHAIGTYVKHDGNTMIALLKRFLGHVLKHVWNM